MRGAALARTRTRVCQGSRTKGGRPRGCQLSRRTDSILNSQVCARGQRFRLGPAELALAGLYSLSPPSSFVRSPLPRARDRAEMPCWRDVRAQATNTKRLSVELEPLKRPGCYSSLLGCPAASQQQRRDGVVGGACARSAGRGRPREGRNTVAGASWPNRRRAMHVCHR